MSRISRQPFLNTTILLVLSLAAPFLPAQANSQTVALPAPHTTLAIFADRPMPEPAWVQLFAALRAGLPAAAAEQPQFDPSPALLRGDRIVPGAVFEAPITVYLHGECILPTEPRRSVPSGALGWVFRSKGHIAPFIHVDCVRIAQLLETAEFGWNRQRRAGAMSQSVARVILHEWAHFASQSASHRTCGLEKAAYSVDDLLAGDPEPIAKLRDPQ